MGQCPTANHERQIPALTILSGLMAVISHSLRFVYIRRENIKGSISLYGLVYPSLGWTHQSCTPLRRRAFVQVCYFLFRLKLRARRASLKMMDGSGFLFFLFLCLFCCMYLSLIFFIYFFLFIFLSCLCCVVLYVSVYFRFCMLYIVYYLFFLMFCYCFLCIFYVLYI